MQVSGIIIFTMPNQPPSPPKLFTECNIGTSEIDCQTTEYLWASTVDQQHDYDLWHYDPTMDTDDSLPFIDTSFPSLEYSLDNDFDLDNWLDLDLAPSGDVTCTPGLPVPSSISSSPSSASVSSLESAKPFGFNPHTDMDLYPEIDLGPGLDIDREIDAALASSDAFVEDPKLPVISCFSPDTMDSDLPLFSASEGALRKYQNL